MRKIFPFEISIELDNRFRSFKELRLDLASAFYLNAKAFSTYVHLDLEAKHGVPGHPYILDKVLRNNHIHIWIRHYTDWEDNWKRGYATTSLEAYQRILNPHTCYHPHHFETIKRLFDLTEITPIILEYQKLKKDIKINKIVAEATEKHLNETDFLFTEAL